MTSALPESLPESLPGLLPGADAARLGTLFTRLFFSAATYVAQAQPFEVAEDRPLLDALARQRAQDREHARLLADLLRHYDRVPEAGVFPYWHRDLNYLSVTCLARFVVEALGDDLEVIDEAAAASSQVFRTVHATLRAVRSERAASREALRPLVSRALEREHEAYGAGAARIRETREARHARERAAAEAEREAQRAARAAAPAAPSGGAAADLPDPDEPGISAKERARRTMLRKRAGRS
jgi:hypothetical protein